MLVLLQQFPSVIIVRTTLRRDVRKSGLYILQHLKSGPTPVCARIVIYLSNNVKHFDYIPITNLRQMCIAIRARTGVDSQIWCCGVVILINLLGNSISGSLCYLRLCYTHTREREAQGDRYSIQPPHEISNAPKPHLHVLPAIPQPPPSSF